MKNHSKSIALIRLKDILAAGQAFQSTSQEINQKWLDMRNGYKLTLQEWEYLRGYKDCVIDGWYRHNLIFAVEYKGKLYPQNWDTLPEEIKDILRAKKPGQPPLPTGHYWLNPDKSIGKVFFSSGNVK